MPIQDVLLHYCKDNSTKRSYIMQSQTIQVYCNKYPPNPIGNQSNRTSHIKNVNLNFVKLQLKIPTSYTPHNVPSTY